MINPSFTAADEAREPFTCLSRTGTAQTHQSSSSATFFSNIDAKAWAPTLPMLFPTRLDVIKEQKHVSTQRDLREKRMYKDQSTQHTQLRSPVCSIQTSPIDFRTFLHQLKTSLIDRSVSEARSNHRGLPNMVHWVATVCGLEVHVGSSFYREGIKTLRGQGMISKVTQRDSCAQIR